MANFAKKILAVIVLILIWEIIIKGIFGWVSWTVLILWMILVWLIIQLIRLTKWAWKTIFK